MTNLNLFAHGNERMAKTIHLPEFKKEQIRIQISNSRILKITGENIMEGKKKKAFHERSKGYERLQIK
ncbi:hypothetical protein R6Q59_027695 [Mikania micrantha]